MARGRAKAPAKGASLAAKMAAGFQDDADLFTPGPDRDRLLNQMAAQGARDVRVNVVYGKVRKPDGSWDFSAHDELVDALRARGMRPQFTLMSTPRYNTAHDQSLSYQNNDPKMWKAFAQATAQHFRGRVGRYSIGNEQNYDAFQAGAQKNPQQAGRDYRSIYRAGYSGVKGADRGAQVLLGELTSGGGDPALFLKGVLGGKPLKTAGLAYHPYAGGGGWDINSLGALQKTLHDYKLSGKLQTAAGKQAGLYITEMGRMRGSAPDPERIAQEQRDIELARRAGARQYIHYQLSSKAGKQPVGAPDDYGNPGPPDAANGGGWDTSIADAAGNLPRIFRRAAPRAARRPR